MLTKRLQTVLDMVKDNVQIPIIIEPSGSPEEVKTALQNMGVKVTHVDMVGQIQASATPGIIKRISKLPYVKKVYYDEPISIMPHFNRADEEVLITTSEAATLLGVDEVRKEYGLYGKGIKLAVVDTGYSDHPMIERPGIITYDVTGDGIEDRNTHSTHCIGIAAGNEVDTPRGRIHGVAPKADLIIIKVLGNDGTGQTSWVIKGIEKAFELGADVISLSLGSLWDEVGMGPSCKMINEIVFKHNIPCVIAAGNSGPAPGTIGSPGSAAGAITVGSVSAVVNEGKVSNFSSTGPVSNFMIKPDTLGYGGEVVPNVSKELIYSAVAGEFAEKNGVQYAGLAGTSMATPGIAGCMVLLKEYGYSFDRPDFEDKLTQLGMKNHTLKNIKEGWGAFNVSELIRIVDKPESPIIPILQSLSSARGSLYAPLTLKQLSYKDNPTYRVVRLPVVS